jgi:3'-5' exoribonuclease
MNTVAELKTMPRDQRLPFEAVVVLRKCQMKKARNDSEFLMVELGDRTGMFHFVCFQNSAHFAFFSSLKEGVVLRVQGTVDQYQNRFAPNISQAELVPAAELPRHLANLIECAPLPIEEMWLELQEFVALIAHDGLRATVTEALSEMADSFKMSPGAISMHHAYRGGLLEHTLRMARNAKALLPLYPEVNGDLVYAGILLHDIGKCIEYTGDMATTRSRSGIFQGHVVLGYRQARRAAMKSKLDELLLEHLEHIILSHQGELEWGAAAKAATPEAVFVSMIDNLDAKMGMVQHALRSTPDSEEFSEYIPGLGAPLYVRRLG